MNRQILHKLGRKIEIRSQDKWEFSVSRKKTHVVHQIGIYIAAKTHTVFEVRCEQPIIPAHDRAEDSGFVSIYRQGFGKPTCANQCAHSRTCSIVCSANCCTARASSCRFPCLLDCNHEFVSFQVVSEMRAASKSEVRMWCLACSLQAVQLHWRMFTSPLAISSLCFLPVCLRPPLVA